MYLSQDNNLNILSVTKRSNEEQSKHFVAEFQLLVTVAAGHTTAMFTMLLL